MEFSLAREDTASNTGVPWPKKDRRKPEGLVPETSTSPRSSHLRFQLPAATRNRMMSTPTAITHASRIATYILRSAGSRSLQKRPCRGRMFPLFRAVVGLRPRTQPPASGDAGEELAAYIAMIAMPRVHPALSSGAFEDTQMIATLWVIGFPRRESVTLTFRALFSRGRSSSAASTESIARPLTSVRMSPLRRPSW